MQIQNARFEYNDFGRLVANDITRLPLQNQCVDAYYKQNNVCCTHSKKKNALLKKFFTVATFAIGALYVAHRSNLFNPIKREAKKIIKNGTFIEKVKEFVDGSINEETFRKATQNSLNNIITEKSSSKAAVSIAQDILADNDKFNSLFSKVKKTLADEELIPGTSNIKNMKQYREGFTADVIDSLFKTIETTLGKKKSAGQNYKDISNEIIESLFKSTQNQETIVETALLKVIQKRSSTTIDNFIQDILIQSKTGPKIKTII